jgi:hypothetical protein
MTVSEFFENTHNNPPAPFNPHFRAGFREALEEEYGQWCDANDGNDVTKADRRAAYKEIAARIYSKFPSVE